MSESHRPFVHLARALEELLLASAEGLAAWRSRLEAQDQSPIEQAIEDFARLWPAFAPPGDTVILALLREALREERARWQRRAANDPAAQRLRDLCSALLDVIEEEAPSEEAIPKAPRQAPPRRRPGGP